MEYILKFINTYPYLVLFIGSIIDHSGIPFFTILAGILFASSTIEFIPTALSIMVAYILNDIVFVLIGFSYFKKRIEANKSTVFKTVDISILEKGLAFYVKSKNSFYFFSKLIPGIGKYAPIFTGIVDKKLKLSLLKYFIGSTIYFILFFVPSIYIGEQLKKNSKVLGILFLVIFIGIYKVFEILTKRKMKEQK